MASKFAKVVTGNNSLVNGAALLMLAVYLAAVVYRQNVKALALQVWDDFTAKSGGQPAFWQWAISLAILYMLAKHPKTETLFGPLLGIVIVAMLIQLAIKQPQIFNTLDNNIRYLLGGSSSSRT